MMFEIGLTDHVEGPRDQPSSRIFGELAELIRLADKLGVRYAWFAEHHVHAHRGHLPSPLLLALHLAGQTQNIKLGTAIICLNLHHPIDVAEQVATADCLTGGRIAVGFGSGSTPDEFHRFGLEVTADLERHQRFEESLRIIQSVWDDREAPPISSPGLSGRSWIAVNSPGSARIAGLFGFNVLFSHLRTPDQYRQYSEAYRQAGGQGLIAANRPVFVGPDDRSAWKRVEPALRRLWKRFQHEGKIPADRPEPDDPARLADHPINFVVGGPETVARTLVELHQQAPFGVANLEVRWDGLSHQTVLESLERLMVEVYPIILSAPSRDREHPAQLPEGGSPASEAAMASRS